MAAFAGTNAQDQVTVIVAVGAAGEEEFGKDFAKWAAQWEAASAKAGAKHLGIGLSPTNEVTDLAKLKQALPNCQISR